MQNFAVITREFLRQQAIVQVSDEFELSAVVRDLLESAPARQALGERTRATFQAKLDAKNTMRTAGVIVQSLEAEGATR
jgi:3-deoxy-D-manno-octulosonic-acid transferase